MAVLHGGEDSFAVRLEALKNARKSIRIQALVFKGDESGLRIAEILKQKKADGLDVRLIVDAFSNPWLQTQWMYFDLKQHGIEVEGYEAMALQWLNEVPVPKLVPHTDPDALDKRYHEKMWIIDGETADAVAITGGLNIGNEYFRANPADPDSTWRDQDVVVRGAIVGDLVTAFDRNFEYFVGVKRSRGIFNTNLYWDATRTVLDNTGKMPIHYTTDPHDRAERGGTGVTPSGIAVPRRHVPVPAESAAPRRNLYPAGLRQADRARRARGAHRERVFHPDADRSSPRSPMPRSAARRCA